MPSYNTNWPLVYLLKDSQNGHFKIGRTSNLPHRLSQLNSSRVKPLKVIDAINTASRAASILAETYIHRAFKPYQIRPRREWFRLPDPDTWRETAQRAVVQANEDALKRDKQCRLPPKVIPLPRTSPVKGLPAPVVIDFELSAATVTEHYVLAVIPRPPWRLTRGLR